MLPMTKCGHPACSLSVITTKVRSRPTYPLKAATTDMGVLCVHCVPPVCGVEGSRAAPQYFTTIKVSRSSLTSSHVLILAYTWIHGRHLNGDSWAISLQALRFHSYWQICFLACDRSVIYLGRTEFLLEAMREQMDRGPASSRFG